MRTNFNQMASDKRWVQLKGAVKEARRDMSELAPHPQRKADKTAKADDRDGMLGSMLLDGILGGAFLSAVTDAFGLPSFVEDLPVGEAAEIYDEYSRDRHGHDYILGSANAICHGFNAGATHRRAVPQNAEAAFWDRYLADLPARRAMERNIAGLSRDLSRIEQNFSTQMLKPARLSMGM